MNIIILGAGRVGESVAESLLSEQNDISVIDTDPVRLHKLEKRLDLRGVVGNGIQASVLKQAGAEDADMFIACAPMDETNLVACKVASMRFRVPNTIARVRSSDFDEDEELLGKGGFAVDHVVCPEESVKRYIHQIIDYPQALQVLQFSRGRAHLMATRATLGSPLVNRSIRDFRSQYPEVPMRVVAVYRNDVELRVNPDLRVLPGDEVFVLAGKDKIGPVLAAIHRVEEPVRRVMIAGGGRVGLRLARSLVGQCEVKIIEVDPTRCEYLATQLPSDMLVLHGDAADQDLLVDENVGDMDLFLSLTNYDEDNIMSAKLAKRLGARRVVALVNRRAYADMLEGSEIDIAISPAQAVLGELLAHVRRGAVAAVHSLRRGAAEALEGIAHGDAKTSRLVGRRIEQVKLPTGARIGALVRGEGDTCEVLMAHNDTVIQSGDHVIVFIPSKQSLREVERLFQVRVGFL